MDIRKTAAGAATSATHTRSQPTHASLTAEKITSETGIELLLRLSPSSNLSIPSVGELKPSEIVLLRCPCSQTRRYQVHNLILQTILPVSCGGSEKNILFIDLSFSLNMLYLMSMMESYLTARTFSSTACNKIISSSPRRLKSVTCSYSTELAALLSSLKETVLKEQISVVLCEIHSVYDDKKQLDYIYNSLHDLAKTSKCIAILAYTAIKDMSMPFNFSKPFSAMLVASECNADEISTLKFQRMSR